MFPAGKIEAAKDRAGLPLARLEAVTLSDDVRILTRSAAGGVAGLAEEWSSLAERAAEPAAIVAGERGGTGQLLLKADLGFGEADLVLGRDFTVDAELAARLERIEGVTQVRLSVVEAPRLALVG